MDPIASLDAPTAPLSPGETGVVTVRVRNAGTTVESYRIDVLGTARTWAAVPAEPLALFPDTSGEAVVKFTIPAHNGPRAGTIRVGLRVAALSAAGGSAVEEFDLAINPVITVTAELAPPNSRGWRKGRHQVLLTNEGNRDTSVFIDARDPDEQLACRMTQDAVVPAGDTVAVPLVVIPLKGRLLGRPAAYPFEVEVFPDAGDRVALLGSLRQRPLLCPRILVGAAVVVTAVAAALALGGSQPHSSALDKAGSTVFVTVEVPPPTTSAPASDPTTTAEPPGTTTVPPTATTPTTVPLPGSPAQQHTETQRGAQTASPSAAETTMPEIPAPPADVPAVPPPTTAAPEAVPAAPTSPTTAAPAVTIPAVTPFKIGPTYAGDGVIYAVAPDGRLLFFRDLRQDGTSNGVSGEGWSPAGGSPVGCGFASFQHLIGGEGGVIYGVDADGVFRWYQDLARDGSNDACHGGGRWAAGVMGVGWTGYKHIFYGGDGIIYAVDPSGNLHFCRDVGHVFTPPVCPVIGTGWGDFRQVFASGKPGVIYAITQAGELDYYRDTLRNGTAGGWVGPLPVGNTWQTTYHVFGGAINSSTYPNGVIYAIAADYTLQWRQDTLQDGSSGAGGSLGWLGPTTVGVGFQNVL